MRGSAARRAALRLLAVLLIPCGAAHAWEAVDDEPAWILVDSTARTVSVIEDGRTIQTFGNVSFGRGGVAPLHRSGDGTTPLGTFRVAWIKAPSRFHRFFGLDYPTAEHAENAFLDGLIDVRTYWRIRRALINKQLPSQVTVLGGHIGIHGVGDGDPTLQGLFDWTTGCVALSDEQIDRLAAWVSLGTKVVIR